MTPSPPQLDPSTVLTVVFAAIFGPQLAAYVGPYAAILIGAVVGAAWSLGRQPVTSRFDAVAYFLLMALTAAIFTVPTANALGQWLKMDDPQWLFAPVATFIGGVGRDWPHLASWIGRRALRMWERRAGLRDDDK